MELIAICQLQGYKLFYIKSKIHLKILVWILGLLGLLLGLGFLFGLELRQICQIFNSKR